MCRIVRHPNAVFATSYSREGWKKASGASVIFVGVLDGVSWRKLDNVPSVARKRHRVTEVVLDSSACSGVNPEGMEIFIRSVGLPRVALQNLSGLPREEMSRPGIVCKMEA